MPKDEIVEEAITPLEIEVVADPIVEEEIVPTEEEIIEEAPEEIVEEEPASVEPAVDYQALYENQRATNDQLQQKIFDRDFPEAAPVVETARAEAVVPNPYDDPEGFSRYLADRDSQTTENAVKAVMASPEIQDLRMTVGMREHATQTKETKEELGEFIDMEADQQAIQDIQREYPGLPMNKAAKILSYERLQQKNNQLKEGRVERKKAQVPPTGGATRTVQTRTEAAPEKTTMTTTQAAYASKYFAHHPDVVSGKTTALEKYQSGIGNMADGGYLE